MNNLLPQRSSEIIVLLAHYNDNDRLKNAVKSIEEPFLVDVLILDDGSEIKPDYDELKAIYEGKGNLIIKCAPQNIGASKIRNWGLEMILKTDYSYIAIMDSDDTNKPQRFAKQLQFLDKNPHIDLVGSWGEYYNSEGIFLFTLKHPTSDIEIKKKMYLNSTFLHSSLLFRRKVAESVGEYPDKYKKGGEDYSFTFKVVRKHQTANYPEVLVNITVTKDGLSSQERVWQVFNRIRVIRDNFYFGFYPIAGIARNIILLVTPRGFGIKIRKLFKLEKMPF